MKVGIFYTSITNWQHSPPKKAAMEDFTKGVLACGDRPIDFKDPNKRIEDLDAGFILGYSRSPGSRLTLINSLIKKNIPRIYIDSDVFVDGKKEVKCYRYSVNGVYPSDGEYFLNFKHDPNKTQRILDIHNIKMKPWRKNGDHILVLGQRTQGWNMIDKNGLAWIYEIIQKIKQHTNRPIVVRFHPGDSTLNIKNRHKLNLKFGSEIRISNKEKLLDDLQNAWCCVGYNSTPNCASAIEGIPVYLDRPEYSWAKDVGFTDLSQIEDPPMPERDQWLHKIAHIHYTDDEIVNGFYWKRYKEFYKI